LITGTSLGAVGLLVSWFAVGGTAIPSHLAAWLVVGIGAVVLMGSANAVWLLRGRRSIGERRAALLDALHVLVPMDDLPGATRVPDDSGRPNTLVSVQEGRLYHRATCPLVAGKTSVEATARQHLDAGRAPCGVCAP
jgi:hypothetical protein